MSQELKHTITIGFTLVEADTLDELSDKINKELSESEGTVKRYYAAVLKTSKSTQGIE